jgi:hypothetical protein
LGGLRLRDSELGSLGRASVTVAASSAALRIEAAAAAAAAAFFLLLLQLLLLLLPPPRRAFSKVRWNCFFFTFIDLCSSLGVMTVTLLPPSAEDATEDVTVDAMVDVDVDVVDDDDLNGDDGWADRDVPPPSSAWTFVWVRAASFAVGRTLVLRLFMRSAISSYISSSSSSN